MKRALITGITGQDGAYLARLLLGKGYKVFGGYRRASSMNLWRLDALHVTQDITLLPFDLTDGASCVRMVDSAQPNEIYNLAAQSFVGASFTQPEATTYATGVGALNMLEAMRRVAPTARYYQASSSEVFGAVRESPQTELTPFEPRSPYGAAKAYAHWMTKIYRDAYHLFAVNGILFNHESPLRGRDFVTRKITWGLAQLAVQGASAPPVGLGNMLAWRDWGAAWDYVEGMWSMLQANEPQDFVLATGRTHTVEWFFETAAAAVGFEWERSADGKYTDSKSGLVLCTLDPAMQRPAEVDLLKGDASLARDVLGWEPSTTLDGLIHSMITTDIERVKQGFPF